MREILWVLAGRSATVENARGGIGGDIGGIVLGIAAHPRENRQSGRINLGDQVTVTLTPGQNFSILAKGLGLPIQSFTSSNSVSSILPGQTIAIPASSFTAQSGVTPGAVGTNQIALRFTRISGTMASVALPFFSGNNLPPFFGLANLQEFGATSGRLSLDGVSTLTGITNGSTFSSSALYIGAPSSPVFVAQTVRAH